MSLRSVVNKNYLDLAIAVVRTAIEPKSSKNKHQKERIAIKFMLWGELPKEVCNLCTGMSYHNMLYATLINNS